ncbi:MAG TPA: multiheme c-type cytochrome [Planctomycetota bacterium]
MSIGVTSWGTAGQSPVPRDDPFTTSEQCAVCHTPAPGANAMHSRLGDDVSPYGTWQGTMMANSFRDPYFRAQLDKESASAGEEVQELCLRCHAPMAHHGAVLSGRKAPRLADVEDSLVADDGVSCTVCHLMDGKNFGEASSFSGHPTFNRERRIFGPFADVITGPMQNQVRYTPTQGLHVQKSALCATCHTFYTEHHGTKFPEQTPYLEWRNSEFSDEEGRTDKSRTCQQCHMADAGPTRIARSPNGFDFNVPVRDGYLAHAFVGGNAFMLDLLQAHRDELDILATPEALSRMATATRRQLGEATARLSISPVTRAEDTATFEVQVENLTGHKFPTGYPARRAWLHVQVLLGRQVVFETGAVDARGRLVGIEEEHHLEHVRTVERPTDVVVYEMVALDPRGAPTTYLTKMVKRVKDNRLLPRGWRADGKDIADIAPVGTGNDADFTAGGDKVAFRISLPPRARGRLQVVAAMYYQPVPPLWVDALRTVETEAAKRFVRMYDSADKAPEIVARAVRREQ